MPAFTTLLGRSTAAVAAFNGTMQPGYTYRGYEYRKQVLTTTLLNLRAMPSTVFLC